MKLKLILIIVGIIFTCSCSKSPEDIMKQNLNKYMKKILFIPDSYKPAKFEIIDTIYAGDIMKELDSLHQLKLKVKEHQEEYSKKVEILENAYQNNRYHNISMLKEAIKTRDETDRWIKQTTNWVDSLLSLSMKRIGNTWTSRNPHSIMFYKVVHTYEAKRTDGNMGVSVVQIYFDTTFQIYNFFNLRY